jgi:hypothetical protein
MNFRISLLISGLAQVGEHLPSKCEALVQSPVLQKKSFPYNPVYFCEPCGDVPIVTPAFSNFDTLSFCSVNLDKGLSNFCSF